MALDFYKYLNDDFLDLSSENLKKNNESFLEDDLKALRGFLEEHPEINSIKITGTSLGDRLAEFFKETTVSKLVLSNNKITDNGVNTLLNNSSIKQLNLNSNYVSQETVDLARTREVIISINPEYVEKEKEIIKFHYFKGIFAAKQKQLEEKHFSINEAFNHDIELNGQKYLQLLDEIVTHKYALSILSSRVIGNTIKVLKSNDDPETKLLRIVNGMEYSFKGGIFENPNDRALYTALAAIRDQSPVKYGSTKILNLIHNTFKNLTPKKAAERVNLVDVIDKEALRHDLERNGKKYLQFLDEIVNHKYALSILSSKVIENIIKVLKSNNDPETKFLRIVNKMENLFKEGILENDNDHALFAALVAIRDQSPVKDGANFLASEKLNLIHNTFKNLTPQKAAERVNLVDVIDKKQKQNPRP